MCSGFYAPVWPPWTWLLQYIHQSWYAWPVVFVCPCRAINSEMKYLTFPQGNILMISEGRSGSDTVFTLRDGLCWPRHIPANLRWQDDWHNVVIGLLKVETGKETYERTGLSGKPIRSGGRKHGKERFGMYELSSPTNSNWPPEQWLKLTYGFHQCYMGRKALTGLYGRSRTFLINPCHGYFTIWSPRQNRIMVCPAVFTISENQIYWHKTQIQSQFRVILQSGSTAPRSEIGWIESRYRRYQA